MRIQLLAALFSTTLLAGCMGHGGMGHGGSGHEAGGHEKCCCCDMSGHGAEGESHRCKMCGDGVTDAPAEGAGGHGSHSAAPAPEGGSAQGH